MDPSFHDTFLASAQTASDTVRRLGGNASLGAWMGETGGCYNSGHYNMSNAFMDAFWYLESLAGFARNGATAFCRQTLLGGNYELVDKDTLSPNPDFYAAALFSKLMGTNVLDAAAAVVSDYQGERVRGGDDGGGERLDGGDQEPLLLRAWAHCSKVTTDDGTAGDSSTSSGGSSSTSSSSTSSTTAVAPGSVTVLLLNYGNDTALASIGGASTAPSSSPPAVGAAAAKAKAEAAASSDPSSDSRAPPRAGEEGLLFGQLYLVTGGDDGEDRLHSRTVKLNGVTLVLGSSSGGGGSDDPDAIPALEPRRLPLLPDEVSVALPPHSYAFVVVPPEAFSSGAAACF